MAFSNKKVKLPINCLLRATIHRCETLDVNLQRSFAATDMWLSQNDISKVQREITYIRSLVSVCMVEIKSELESTIIESRGILDR